MSGKKEELINEALCCFRSTWEVLIDRAEELSVSIKDCRETFINSLLGEAIEQAGKGHSGIIKVRARLAALTEEIAQGN